MILPIKDPVPAYWHASKHQIVGLNKQNIIERRPWKGTENAEVENGEHKQDIFVEHVKSKYAVATIGFTTVAEQ